MPHRKFKFTPYARIVPSSDGSVLVDFLITEGDDFIITEGDDFLITE